MCLDCFRIAGMLGLDACAAEVVATSMLPASPEGIEELSTTAPSEAPSAAAASANSDVSEVPSATSALANSDGADDPSTKVMAKPRPAHYVNKLAAKMRKRREAAAAEGREVRSYVKRSELEVMNHMSKESCQTRDAVTNAKDQILSRLDQLEDALPKPRKPNVKAGGEGQDAPKASRKKADPEEKKRKAEEKKAEAETKKRKAEAAKAERVAKAEEKARAKAAKAAAAAQKAAEALKKFDGNGRVSSVPSEATETEKIEGCPHVAGAAPEPTDNEYRGALRWPPS